MTRIYRITLRLGRGLAHNLTARFDGEDTHHQHGLEGVASSNFLASAILLKAQFKRVDGILQVVGAVV